jgi:hypothetical protein
MEISKLSKLESDLNRTRVETILSDLQVALTFAEIAETSRDAATRKRNRSHVRKAVRQIQDIFLPSCSPDTSQRTEIDRILGQLQQQLERWGNE